MNDSTICDDFLDCLCHFKNNRFTLTIKKNWTTFSNVSEPSLSSSMVCVGVQLMFVHCYNAVPLGTVKPCQTLQRVANYWSSTSSCDVGHPFTPPDNKVPAVRGYVNSWRLGKHWQSCHTVTKHRRNDYVTATHKVILEAETEGSCVLSFWRLIPQP